MSDKTLKTPAIWCSPLEVPVWAVRESRPTPARPKKGGYSLRLAALRKAGLAKKARR